MATVTKPIAKSGSALLFSQVGLNVISLVTTIYLARALSKPEFAVLAVLEIMISIFQFSDLGFLSVAVQQAPAKLLKDEQRNEGLSLVKGAFLYRTIVVLLMGVVFYIFAPFFAQLFLKDSNQVWTIRILTLAAIGTIWFYTLQSICQIKNDFYTIASWNFIAGVLRAVLSIAALLLFGFYPFLAAITLSILVSVIGLGWSVRDLVFTRIPPVAFIKTFKYGFPLFIRSFFSYGFSQFDQLVVATLLTPFDLASYNIARRFAKMVAVMIDSFLRPVTIRMASLRDDQNTVQGQFFRKATRYTTFLFLPLSLFIAAASPWIMRIYGGEKYTNNWPLMAIMAITQAVYSLYIVFGSAVFARLQPWSIMLMDGITGGVNFLLAPLLIFLFGKNGVAWGQLLGFSVGIVLAHFLLRSLNDFQFDWGALRKMFPPLITSCSLIVIGQLVHFSLWIVPVYIAIAGILYVYWLGRRIGSEDWELMQTIVPASLLPHFLKMQRVIQRPFWKNNAHTET